MTSATRRPCPAAAATGAGAETVGVGIESGDAARAFRVAKRLQAGHVGINTAQRNHDAPFGGFKMSGIGRDGGDYSLEAYSEMQSIIWAG